MTSKLTKQIKDTIDVSKDDLTQMLSYFKPLMTKRNEIILSVGQYNDKLYFIEYGCLRIFHIDKKGHDITHTLSFESDLLTALHSYLTEEPSNEFIQAVDKTKLYVITKKDVSLLTQTFPAWSQFYMQFIEHACVKLSNRYISLVTMSDEERYEQLWQQNPHIVSNLSNQIVGSYVQISHRRLQEFKESKKANNETE